MKNEILLLHMFMLQDIVLQYRLTRNSCENGLACALALRSTAQVGR